MSFVNTFFLAALGAMALPVLFHFVRKMRARTVPFSSLMFLSATPLERVRRRRLRDVLLMMLRATILGLLVLAFTRPFLPPDQLPFAASEERESVVYLIDNSYSMQVDGVLDEARQAVLDRIDAADRADEIAVVTFSDFATQLSGFDADHALHRSIVGDVVASANRTTDFFEPLRLASEILESARHEARRVVLVSDMQQVGWTGPLDNWHLAPGVGFEPVDVGREVDANRYFGDVAVAVQRAGNEALVRIDGRVEVSAPEGGSVTSASVDLEARGGISDRAQISESNGGRFSFQRAVDRGGYFQGELTLPSDVLGLDNTFYFTQEIAQRPTVLVVDGTPSGSTGLIRGDAYFLEKAFAPDRARQAVGQFSFERAQRRTLSAVPSTTTILFVANLASLTEREVAGLQRFASEGGNVVVTFGDNLNVGAFSRSLQALGIATVSGVTRPDVASVVGQVDWRHPVFAPFAGPTGGAILKPEFRRFVNLTPEPGAQVVGTFDSGEPFLIERRVGTGSIVAVASTLGNAWTDFPINAMFVPFVYQLARYAADDHRARTMYTVGDNVSLAGNLADRWEVRTPSGAVYRVDADSTGSAFFLRTDEVGHYIAMAGTRRLPFSVNVDRAESALASRDTDEAYASVVAPAVEQPDYADTASIALEAEEKRQKLWRWFLLAALAVFALETILANRPNRTS